MSKRATPARIASINVRYSRREAGTLAARNSRKKEMNIARSQRSGGGVMPGRPAAGHRKEKMPFRGRLPRPRTRSRSGDRCRIVISQSIVEPFSRFAESAANLQPAFSYRLHQTRIPGPGGSRKVSPGHERYVANLAKLAATSSPPKMAAGSGEKQAGDDPG